MRIGKKNKMLIKINISSIRAKRKDNDKKDRLKEVNRDLEDEIEKLSQKIWNF